MEHLSLSRSVFQKLPAPWRRGACELQAQEVSRKAEPLGHLPESQPGGGWSPEERSPERTP